MKQFDRLDELIDENNRLQAELTSAPAVEVTIETLDPVKLHQRLMVLEAAVQPFAELWEAWRKYASSSDSGDYNLTEWLYYENDLTEIAKMLFELAAAAALKAGE